MRTLKREEMSEDFTLTAVFCCNSRTYLLDENGLDFKDWFELVFSKQNPGFACNFDTELEHLPGQDGEIDTYFCISTDVENMNPQMLEALWESYEIDKLLAADEYVQTKEPK